MKILVFLKLVRLNQWIKNGFVFMPLVFSGRLFNSADFMSVLFAFFIFCLLSTSVYILNDLVGIDRDKVHPKKKNRPLAAGTVKRITALALLIAILFFALILSYRAGRGMSIIALLYLTTHLIYNITLKKKVILDAISIALGFELRIWAGSVALNIHPSSWIQLCVFLLALLISFSKRKTEKRLLNERAAKHRDVLIHYSPFFLDQMITISATLCIMSYGLYVYSGDIASRSGHPYMIYTMLFVVYGIFRYLYLIDSGDIETDPEEIFTTDIPFILNLLLWIFSIILIFYCLSTA